MSASRGLGVSLGVFGSLGSLAVSRGLCRLSVFSLPLLHPMGSSLTPSGPCHLPVRPFPAALIPHASVRRVARRIPPAAAATCERGRGWRSSRPPSAGLPLSSGALGLPRAPPPRTLSGCCLGFCGPGLGFSLSQGLGLSCLWIVLMTGNVLFSILRRDSDPQIESVYDNLGICVSVCTAAVFIHSADNYGVSQMVRL